MRGAGGGGTSSSIGSLIVFLRDSEHNGRTSRRASPAIPAAESTLGSHPCVALSSSQVLPEWINRNLVGNRFAANGDNPLNLVSHARGSLHSSNSRCASLTNSTNET